jgi:hypothetical protein
VDVGLLLHGLDDERAALSMIDGLRVITFRLSRNLRTNSSSAGVSMKNLISSARPISGKPRSCAISSAENTSLVATGAPSPED